MGVLPALPPSVKVAKGRDKSREWDRDGTLNAWSRQFRARKNFDVFHKVSTVWAKIDQKSQKQHFPMIKKERN